MTDISEAERLAFITREQVVIKYCSPLLTRRLFSRHAISRA